MNGTINELPNIDTAKYNIDESGNVLRDKKITDEEKYEEFVNFTCEMLGLNKPIDILKLCQLTSDFIRPYEMKIKELVKEKEQLKAQIEKMKCCENCKHFMKDFESTIFTTLSCKVKNCNDNDKWELAE